MSADRRFLGLFAISALLHALAIIVWEAPPSLSTPAGPEALRVTLLAPARLQPTTRANSRAETPRFDPPTSDANHAVAPAATAPDTGRDQPAVEVRGHRLEAALHAALRPHFYYPPTARRHGWQGEVRLALRVEANGFLTRVRIVRSSGYGILDRAALHSLGRLQHLPDAVALLNGQSHDLVLPVQYQLTGIF